MINTHRIFLLLAFSILLLQLVPLSGVNNFTPAYAAPPSASLTSGPAQIYKMQSGLVASDSLTTGDTSKWQFNGSAAEMQPNAPHEAFEDSSGMLIGVLAPSANNWAGYFAISPLTPAKLFHARVIVPDTKPISGTYNDAVYIQQEMNQDPRIDAMGCGADVFPTETQWNISLQAGDKNHELVYQSIYSNNNPSLPLSRECTLVTNGSNELTAYIDGEKVFSSNKMNLNMPQPFQYYLETQTNSVSPSSGNMFTGRFTDYYATTSDKIKVTNVVAGSIVKVIDVTSGSVLASSVADTNGISLVDVGRYHMPINANVVVYDGTGTVVLATTNQSPGIYGGDVYNVGTSTKLLAKVNVNAVDQSGAPIRGMPVTIFKGTTQVASGKTPFSFNNANTDVPYYAVIGNDGRYTFDHWSDSAATLIDSKFSTRVFVPTTTTVTLTASFVPSSIPSAPTSLTSLTQYTTNLNTPTIIGEAQPGFSITLYDGQTAIGSPSITSSAGTWSIATPILTDGNHVLWARATSTTGGTASPFSSPITMTIDTTLPSVSITNATLDSVNHANIAGGASDSLSDIRVVEVQVDSSAFQAATPRTVIDWSSWTFTSSSTLSPGVHHITARATNYAGSQSTASVDLNVPNPPGQSTVTVNSVDMNGNMITGLYTTLSQGGSVISAGFTPVSFALNDGQTYAISASDYGSNYFDHWQDTGDTSRSRTITTSGSSFVTLTAVYRNTPLPPPPSGQYALSVSSVDMNGNAITGLYVTLSQNNAVISTGFTTASFNLNDGQTYQIAVSNYNNVVFDHWQDDGTTSSVRTVTMNSGSPSSIVAVYRTNG
jgi:hypothetical protein